MATDAAVLRTRLEQAEEARHGLLTGAQVVKVAYAQGDGSRQVEYTPASLGALNAYIADLRRQLGETSGRRAIGIRF